MRDIGVTGVQTCALPISTGVPWKPRRAKTVTALATTPARRASAVERAGGVWVTEIGRASCRERVETSVVAVSLTKKALYSRRAPAVHLSTSSYRRYSSHA